MAAVEIKWARRRIAVVIMKPRLPNLSWKKKEQQKEKFDMVYICSVEDSVMEGVVA